MSGKAWLSQLGGGLGDYCVRLGSGGDVRTFAAAISRIEEKTRFIPAAVPAFVGSVTGTSSGTIDVRRITSDGVNDLQDVRGQLLGVNPNGTTTMFLGRVSGADFIELFAPIHADMSAVTFNLYEIIPATIQVLPGTRLVDVPTSTLPPFCTISGLQNSCSITMADGAYLTHNTQGNSEFGANFTFFDGVDLNAFQYTAPASNNAIMLYPAETTPLWGTQMVYGMRRLTMRAGSMDALFFTTGSTPLFGGGISGTFVMQDVEAYGQYDIIRCGTFYNARIINSRLTARSSVGLDEEASPIGIGMGNNSNAQPYPVQRLIVEGGLLEARNYQAGDNAVKCYAVGIRNPMPSQFNLHVTRNTIVVRNLTAADTGDADGVVVTSNVTGTNTPGIYVFDNDMHVSHANAAANKRLMHSANASYVIKRALNRAIASDGVAGTTTIGSNTADQNASLY